MWVHTLEFRILLETLIRVFVFILIHLDERFRTMQWFAATKQVSTESFENAVRNYPIYSRRIQILSQKIPTYVLKASEYG